MKVKVSESMKAKKAMMNPKQSKAYKTLKAAHTKLEDKYAALQKDKNYTIRVQNRKITQQKQRISDLLNGNDYQYVYDEKIDGTSKSRRGR